MSSLIRLYLNILYAYKNNHIELITTPFAHPILPLVHNSDLGKRGDTVSDFPNNTFNFEDDARAHVKKGKDIFFENFGFYPNGMWPVEGQLPRKSSNISTMKIFLG